MVDLTRTPRCPNTTAAYVGDWATICRRHELRRPCWLTGTARLTQAPGHSLVKFPMTSGHVHPWLQQARPGRPRPLREGPAPGPCKASSSTRGGTRVCIARVGSDPSAGQVLLEILTWPAFCTGGYQPSTAAARAPHLSLIRVLRRCSACWCLHEDRPPHVTFRICSGSRRSGLSGCDKAGSSQQEGCQVAAVPRDSPVGIRAGALGAIAGARATVAARGGTLLCR